MDISGLAAAERRDLADFLSTLSPEQWRAPTLCDGWTVHDVVSHVMSYDALTWGQLGALIVQGRGSMNRVNAIGVELARSRSPHELVEAVRTGARPRGLTTMFGSRVALTDAMIHHQDIRRSLAVPREIPTDRLRVALSFARIAPTLPGLLRCRGLRLVATDLDWTSGSGPEVVGRAESLLMLIGGRPDALDEVTGSGIQTLRSRFAR